MEKENTFFKDYQELINSFDRMKKDTQAYNYKYTHIKDVLKAVKENCKKHNFIFIQKLAITYTEHDLKNTLRTEIRHISGEKVEGEVEVISKDSNDPQKVGAGITYMRRYSLTCMFGIEEEDDDAQKASAKYPQKTPSFQNPPF